MSDPTPKDLSGILNCNALYSFTTGIIQLLFGSILMYEQGFIFQILVPLSISGSSLALSVLNIYYNFSAVCVQIEAETRLADRILQRASGQLEEGKRQLIAQRETKLAEIEKTYAGRTDPPSIVAKRDEIENTSRRFAVDLQHLDADNMDALEVELVAFRSRVRRIQDIMRAKGTQKGVAGETSGVDQYNVTVDAWKAKEQKIIDIKQAAITNLDESLSAEDFEAAMEKINADADKKLKLLRGQRKKEAEAFNV